MKHITLTEQDIYKGDLILINKYHLIHNYPNTTDLEAYSEAYPNILLLKKANKFLTFTLNEIKAENDIVPVSGYRDLEEQTEIFNTSLIESGEEFTLKYVALPNASEHQTGLAIDLGKNQGEIDFIRPAFPRTGICEEFRNTALKYGFIERYKEEKESITNISAEEWHFRYVGYPHSKIMFDNDLCLEEYIEYLKNFTRTPLSYENYQISYMPYKGEDIELDLSTQDQVSGNNIDGFIITRVIR